MTPLEEEDTLWDNQGSGEGSYRSDLENSENILIVVLVLLLVVIVALVSLTLVFGLGLDSKEISCAIYLPVLFCFFSLVVYYIRRKNLEHARTARRLGLDYYPGTRDLEEATGRSILERYAHLNMIELAGKDSWTFSLHDIYTGSYRGHPLHFFNLGPYHCGGIIELAGRFPELRVWHKVLSPVGMARRFDLSEIDLDNLAFSRSFNVKCRSRKFCYHVLTPRVMEILLSLGRVRFEIEEDSLFLGLELSMTHSSVELWLDQLVGLRELLPAYLFRREPEENGPGEVEEEKICQVCGEVCEYIPEHEDHYCWDCREYLGEMEEVEM